MNTQNLTKTNIIDSAKAELIEKELGIEINQAYNYNISFENRTGIIQPYEDLYSISRTFKKGMESKVLKFDAEKIEITMSYRGKWKRQFETIILKGEKVGYKLPTTSRPEGYIYGNFKPIN
jgi:hypothetical protein